jgi:hypothetical protein
VQDNYSIENCGGTGKRDVACTVRLLSTVSSALRVFLHNELTITQLISISEFAHTCFGYYAISVTSVKISRQTSFISPILFSRRFSITRGLTRTQVLRYSRTDCTMVVSNAVIFGLINCIGL